MFTKSHRVATLPEIAALVVAFVVGFWSLGFWTGLVASLFCYAEQQIGFDPMDLGIRGKIGRGLVLLFVAAILLHFIFPGTAAFDVVIRIFCICLFAGLVQYKLEPKDADR